MSGGGAGGAGSGGAEPARAGGGAAALPVGSAALHRGLHADRGDAGALQPCGAGDRLVSGADAGPGCGPADAGLGRAVFPAVRTAGPGAVLRRWGAEGAGREIEDLLK